MTNLQLVEVDPTPGGCGLPSIETIKAVSSSYSALVDYCKKTFNKPIGEGDSMWDIYYKIEDSKIEIVQDNHNKFDK